MPQYVILTIPEECDPHKNNIAVYSGVCDDLKTARRELRRCLKDFISNYADVAENGLTLDELPVEYSQDKTLAYIYGRYFQITPLPNQIRHSERNFIFCTALGKDNYPKVDEKTGKIITLRHQFAGHDYLSVEGYTQEINNSIIKFMFNNEDILITHMTEDFFYIMCKYTDFADKDNFYTGRLLQIS